MSIRCVALLSGGLDSILAIKLMQEQGIEVEALNFKTAFTCCQDTAGQVARELGVRLTVIGQDDDYLDLIRKPKFGYGKGANPCIDCRIYMFQKAKFFMEQNSCRFIVSGEVIGQRPKSQKKRDLTLIANMSDLDGLLLRPLSAQKLPPTTPEKCGWVDRSKLYGIWGRGRKELIELANRFGIEEIPSPSTGCALTEPRFSKKVFDLIQIDSQSQRWDFEILKTGRHFRFDEVTKIIVGRNEEDNDSLLYMHQRPDAVRATLISPKNFPGPRAMMIGPETEASLDFAVSLLLRYSRNVPSHGSLELVREKDRRLIPATSSTCTKDITTLAMLK